MKLASASLLGLFLAVSPIRAEEGFLFFQNEIPKSMVTSDSTGSLVIFELSGYEEYYFEGFSPGGSSDLLDSERKKFENLVRYIASGKHLFFKGVADDNAWNGKYSKKEYERLDYGLAMARAQWARDAAGRGFILLPTLKQGKGRGFYVYVASYSFSKEPVKKSEIEKEEKSVSENSDAGGSTFVFRVGGSVGFSAIWTNGMSFFFPTTSLDFIQGENELSLMGGWRPAAEGVWGNRAESMFGMEFTRWRDWIGFSLGFNAAWETVRSNDRFTDRVAGFYAGPKICRYWQNWVVQGGLNMQMLNLNRVGRQDSWWNPGFGTTLKIQYFLP